MQVVFRLAYSAAVAVFFILLVVFGTQTFYSEPDYPAGRPASTSGLPNPSSDIYCSDRECFRNGAVLDESQDSQLSEGDRMYVQAVRSYFDDWQTYSRNVFIVAGLLGVLAIGAGIYLYRRVEALPLGLVVGGIGAVIYGWIESARGPGETDTTSAFIVAALGFAILAGGGNWFLNADRKKVTTD